MLIVRFLDQSKSKLPCRIVCSVEGLEWFIYNNVPAYEAMKNILGMSDGNISHERDGIYHALAKMSFTC